MTKVFYSADNNPMLRDGITGDWIGTFLGHKGAVWQARLSVDATIAATAAADFSAYVIRRPNSNIMQMSNLLLTSQLESCEMNAISTTPNDPGVLSVAAGKAAYFFDPVQPGRLLKKTDFSYELASVAVNKATSRFVTGSTGDTWARVYDLETNDELEVQRGHHGPIWSLSYSPDGKIYGTGSEDGTIKLWKACREPYGLWR
ncbi:WD repeat protein [Trichophyton tonsurans CBS 112818]|uniref:Serine-threonine kinase receptor-associated protein n=1 Tax=Trichophyton tonsurans (strain CBS 112818) TaxID=647933 RepID=F2RPE7_TRIT1|nr:WD repeat protein [Trichophyton tonsurans CBS 112818]